MKPNASSQRPIFSLYQCFSRVPTATAILLLILWHGSLAAEEETLRYSVAPGDNPWSITEKLLHGIQFWKPLLRLNNIDHPRQLPPGTQLKIPLSWLKADAAKVRVKAVAGNANYTSASDSSTKPLRLDTLLAGGDRINIGDQGSAVLEYADGSTLFLGSNTQVELTRANKYSDSGLADSEVKLKSGRTESRVKTRGTRFEINTPSASTAVRGTQFRTSVDRQDTKLSRIEVLTGSVAVGGTGNSRDIAAGFGTTVLQGEPPAPPIPLLPAPVIEVPADYSRIYPVEFSWQAIEGAEKYRLQVKVAGSDHPLLDQVTARTGLSTDALDDGRFSLHLRAIDEAGLEGKESTREFQLDARPQPPLAVTPQFEQVVRTGLPAFEWTRPLGVNRVHFQLTEEKGASPLLDFKDYPKTQFIPDALPPGTYTWRLASQNEDEEGPFGESQIFTLKPAPGEPAVSSEGNDREILLRWPDAGEGRSYQVHLAAENDFQTVIEDQMLAEPVWQADRPSMPSYFRVRVIDTDGYEGAWSTPQMIDPAPTPWHLFVVPTALLLLLAL